MFVDGQSASYRFHFRRGHQTVRSADVHPFDSLDLALREARKTLLKMMLDEAPTEDMFHAAIEVEDVLTHRVTVVVALMATATR